MLIYVARRVAWTLVVLLAVLLITFLVFFEMPGGDPAARFAGKAPTKQSIAEVRHRLHLDEPFYVVFGYYVKSIVTGDEYGWPGLGYSYTTKVPVKEQIAVRAPRTLWLVAGAAVLWVGFGVLLGVISAVKKGRLVDRTAMGVALLGITMPTFLLGLVVLFVARHKLGLPVRTGYVPLSDGVCCGANTWFMHMLLPWFVLSLGFMGIYARLTRNNLLETLGEDYIRTARAKGVRESRVILRHGLRASLAPIVTMLGLDIALLVGGAILVEQVFDFKGLGWLAFHGYEERDLPTILGVVVLTTMAVAVANLVVDIAYALLDPRVRYA
jgi:peptide/nickel transport system permease protein